MPKSSFFVSMGTALMLSVASSRGTQVSDFASLGARSGNAQTINCQGSHKVRITVCTPSVVKVEFDPSGQFNPSKGDLLKAEFATHAWPAVSFTVLDSTYVKLQTAKLTLRIQKSPFRIRYYDAANTTLITGDDASRGLSSDSADLPWVRLTRTPAEHFFGWGQPRDMFDRRIQSCDKTNLYLNSAAWGHLGTEAPFMYSTGGYGVFFLFDALGGESPDYDLRNTGYGDYKPSVKPGSRPPYCAYYFINGPTWREVINSYTLVSGRPQKLAKKWYGVHRDWFNFTRLMKMPDFVAYVDSMRAGKYPCDVIRFDNMYNWGSAGNSPTQEYLQFLQHCKTLGFIIGGAIVGSIGGWCFPGDGNPTGGVMPNIPCTPLNTVTQIKAAVDRGFDFGWYDNTGWGFRYSDAKKVFEQWRDARNGDSTMAFVSKGWYSIVSQSYLGGHTGDVLYDCMTVDTAAVGPNCKDGFWRVVPAALEQGLVGYHASYTDLGVQHDWNYIGTCLRPIISEHLGGGAGGYGGCFATMENNRTEPWGYWPVIQQMIRKWHGFHYRFIPYLFTYSMIAHETGMPVWRHMMCHDPKNPATWDKSMQAYVGEDIIISPYYEDQLTNKNLGVRKGIWLPAGTWYDYFEGTKYTGPTTFDYPVDPGTGPLNKKLPMFVRAGAIVPLMEPMQFVKEKPESLITVQVWPAAGTTSFTLYEDEKPVKTGLQMTHVDNQQTTVTIGAFAGGKYCATATSRKYQVEFHNVPKPLNVTSDGAVLPNITGAQLAARTAGWLYDTAKGRICYVNASGDASKGFAVVALYVPMKAAPGDGNAGMRQGVAISVRGRTLLVSVPSPGDHVIGLFDARGRLVTQRRGSGPPACVISINPGLTGFYLLKVSAEGRTVVKKLVF